jgi:hypothetical protein
VYYVLTGVWPLLSLSTFEAVTGTKADKWLVKTVGVLVAVTGAVLTSAGIRRAVGPEIALLAVGNSAGLAGIDVVYARRGRISRVYLLDALVELLLIAAWAISLAGRDSARAAAPG